MYSGRNSYGTSCIGGQTKCIGGHFCMVHPELLLFRATIFMQHSPIHVECCIHFVGALCQNCRSYMEVNLVCRKLVFPMPLVEFWSDSRFSLRIMFPTRVRIQRICCLAKTRVGRSKVWTPPLAQPAKAPFAPFLGKKAFFPFPEHPVTPCIL